MKKENYVAPSTEMVLFINKSYTCEDPMSGDYVKTSTGQNAGRF